MNNDALCVACREDNIERVHILLNHGADPNYNDGVAFLAASERGRVDIMRLLFSYGAQLQNRFFDGACYWDNYQAAYWLYLHGMRGYETPEFEIYKAHQEAIRDRAARKIYFWILPKLYRNNEFVIQQASTSYDKLFKEN